ncbi:hypothetical protein A9G42_05005 [Gilliamella sp. Nev6-6]|uniref:YdgA family protein n=2 Tax=unclassified Gilliamella TaxID=2685620 RepID=UPI00080F3A27|nr:DUF945 family protein [Gilliamella apicola]OCG77623.1 hypothetical protein A9G42_05005 [Gilliamella apicola]
MKKTTLAIGIVAVLGVAYVGMAWQTGNIIENNIDNQLAQITAKINEFQDDFTVSVMKSNYEKNIFSTKLHLTVTVSPQNTLDENAKPKTLFDDDITIHHGPFPIAALAKGTLTPQKAWLEYEMTEQSNPTLWKLAGNQPFIAGHIGISYGEYITLKLANKAIQATQSEIPSINDGILNVSNGSYTFSSYADATDVKAKVQLDKLDYISDDNNYSLKDVNVSLKPLNTLEDFEYQFNIGHAKYTLDGITKSTVNIDNFQSKGNFNYKNQNGDTQSSVDKLAFTFATASFSKVQSVVINNMIVNQKSTLNNANTVDGSLFSSIDSILWGQQNLGKVSLDFNFQGADKDLFSDQFSLEDFDEIIDSSRPVHTKFSLNKFNWHNAAGDINFNFVMDVKDIGKDALENNNNNVDKIDRLKLQLSAPFDVLGRISAQIEHPNTDNVTPEQINKASSNLVMMSKMFLYNSPIVNFSKDGKQGIFTDIEYSRALDNVKVNDKTMTKKAFLNSLQ